jgi:hypothetical protein
MEKKRMNDWRLQGQEKFLMGAELSLRKYQPYRKGWDHDHCEFCGKKFSMNNNDTLEGYATSYGYRWICKECFADFKDIFKFKIIPPI